jgi:hypothetical protein
MLLYILYIALLFDNLLSVATVLLLMMAGFLGLFNVIHNSLCTKYFNQQVFGNIIRILSKHIFERDTEIAFDTCFLFTFN